MLVVAALLLAAGPVRADDDVDPVRQHFDRGAALYEQKQYASAAREYELALQAGGHAALWFNIAEAHRLAGDAVRALAAYRAYLARMPDAPNRAEAEKRIAELEPIAAQAPAPTPPAQAPPPYGAPPYG